MEFYEPSFFRTQHKSNRQASNAEETINPLLSFESEACSKNLILTASEAISRYHKDCLKFFDDLLVAGVCREQARGVLPQNLYTEYYATANLNNILKFVSLRTHDGAQWEIQKMANAMLDIIKDLWPVTISSYQNNK